LALTSVGAALAQSTEKTDPEFYAWTGCVGEAAARFAQTSETAAFVAQAALLACRKERQAFADRLRRDGFDLIRAGAAMTVLEETLSDDTIVFVMDYRTGR
jgi:hypothetical protein